MWIKGGCAALKGNNRAKSTEGTLREIRAALPPYHQEARNIRFFSKIASEARRNGRSGVPSQSAVPERRALPWKAPPEPVVFAAKKRPAPLKPRKHYCIIFQHDMISCGVRRQKHKAGQGG